MNLQKNSEKNFRSTPIRVIHTSGSDFEIGMQHASMLGQDVEQGMVKFFAQFWERLTDAGKKSLTGRLGMQAFRHYVAPILRGWLIQQIPDYAKQRMEGMGKQSGLSPKDLYPLLVLPDFGPVLQAIQSQVFPHRFVEFQPPQFGCSSYFVEQGSFYFGRNLDFPGTGYWDRYPVIQCFDRKKGLRFIGFTSAGIPFGGITGVNEARISVALHQHYTNRYSWRGELPFFVAERVLQQANTLEEAIEIIERSKVASSWAFLLADGKTKRACIVEALPDRKALRFWNSAEGPLAHSNYLLSESCRDCETSMSARMSWDNFSRRQRMVDGLAEIGSSFTPAQGVKLLGDGWDPFWGTEKILNRVVSQNFNIKSLLMDLSEMKVWIAEREGPPVHLGNYREFDLGEIFAGRSGDTGRSLPGFRFQSESHTQAKMRLIEAYMAGVEGDTVNAMKGLDACLATLYSPEVAHIRAVLLLQQGELEQAAEGFRVAMDWTEKEKVRRGRAQLPPEYFESMLFLARTLDVQKKRVDAKAIYARLAAHPDLQDSNIRSVAQKAKPYTMKKARSILMPFSTYVPFQ